MHRKFFYRVCLFEILLKPQMFQKQQNLLIKNTVSVAAEKGLRVVRGPGGDIEDLIFLRTSGCGLRAINK